MTKSFIKLLLLTILLSMLCTVGAQAQTYNAASCSFADVNAVINGPVHTVVNGDRINIPAGTCTWNTNGITIPAGVNISIIGAGQGTTILNDSIPTNASQCVMFVANPSTVGSLTRFSGMTIQPGSGATAVCAAINVLGKCNASGCPNLRVDHITFPSAWATQASCCTGNSYGLTAIGDVFGVVDHNIINGAAGQYLQLVELSHASYQGLGSYGDNSWAQSEAYGSANFLFFEDNAFNTSGCCENEGNAGGFANRGGGRVVVRHNQFLNMDNLNFAMGWHGTESNGRPRGGRAFEFYNNTFTCSGLGGNCAQVAGGRSGTGLIHDNITNNTSLVSNFFTFSTYRSAANIGPWGPCDGTSPFDLNEGTTYYTGTVQSFTPATGDVATITVAGNPWTTNQWVNNGLPYSIHDAAVGGSLGEGKEIVSNTTNTLTLMGAGPGAWTPTNGDTFTIQRAIYCIDQAGGRGAAATVYNSTDPPTPQVPPNEVVSPTYLWNDTFGGGTPTYGHAGSNTARVIQNRDFYMENINQAAQSSPTSPFNGTTAIGMGHGTLANRPTTCTTGVAYWDTGASTLYKCTSTNTWTAYYTPYTYPHPLISGTSGTSVNPPGNLAATVN